MKKLLAYLATAFGLLALFCVFSGLTPKAYGAVSKQSPEEGGKIVCESKINVPVATSAGSTAPDPKAVAKKVNQCVKGFVAAQEKNAPKISNVSSNKGPCHTSLFKNDRSAAFQCQVGYVAGYLERGTFKINVKPPTAKEKEEAKKDQEASEKCMEEFFPNTSGVLSKLQKGFFDSCVAGYIGALNDRAEDDVCGGTLAVNVEYCKKGWALGGGSEDNQEPPSCESSGFNLSWIMCPFIEGLAQAIDSMYDSIIQPLLYTDPINITEPNKDDKNIFAIWSTFRIYGNVILVIALLVIIFGEVIGGGLVDAYTVRKTLPRILVAAILINLSIYIVALAVDVSNVVGVGIQSLMESPFRAANAFEMHLGFGSSGAIASGIGLAGLVGVGAAIWAGGMLAAFLEMFLLFFLIPAFLSIMAVMITILIREGLIIFLTIVAPVAFALYCMPNTEKYFKQWWDLLFKTLLVFPVIAVVFAMGNILAVTINSTASGITGALTELMSVFALILPLFLIPFSFRIAGGVMGQISGIIQDRKGRIAAPINKFRAGRARKRGAEFMERAHEADLYRDAPKGSKRARINSALQTAALAPKALEYSGGKPGRWRENMASLKSEDKISGISKRAEHSTAFQQMSKVDTLLNAATHGNMREEDWRQYLQQQGMKGQQLEQSVGQIRRARAEMGESFEAAALIANSGTGTGLADGPGEVARHIARISEGDEAMQGALIAQVRATAKQAGRGDIADPSFGSYLGAVKSIHGQNTEADIQAAEEAATRSLTHSGFQTLNPAQAMNDRGQSLKNRMPVLRKNLEDATALAVEANQNGYAVRTNAKGEQVRISPEEADRKAMEALAQIGALEASGGTMENRKILSEELLSRTMPGIRGPVGDVGTVQDNLEAFKTDPLYQQYLTQYRDYEGSPLAPQGLTPQQIAALEQQRAARGEPPTPTETPEGQG